MTNSTKALRSPQNRDFDKRNLDRRYFGVAILLTAVIYAPTLALSFGHDQNVFAEIGALILKGKLPYIDAWDIKPPNIFYVYALAECIFGPHEIAIRVFDFVSIVLTGGLVFLFVSLNASNDPSASNRMGLLASFLFAVTAMTLGLADTAQTESFALPWIIGAALLSYHSQDSHKIFVAGLLLAVAGFFKTTNFIFFFPIAIELVMNSRRRSIHLILFIGGCIVGSLAELGFMWQQGFLHEYLAITRTVFAGHASELAGTPVTIFSVLRIIWVYLGAWTIVALVGVIALSSARLRAKLQFKVSSRFAIFLVAIFVAGAVSVLVQQKGWGYHYVVLLPGLLPLTALVSYPILAKISHRVSQKISLQPYLIGVVLTLFITLIPLSGARWLHVGYDSLLSLRDHPKYLATLGAHNTMYYPPCTDALAEYLQHHSAPNEAVFILGQEPGAYWKADRMPASRYIYTLLFTSPIMKQENFDELARSLEVHAPAIIAIERFDSLGFSGTTTTSEDLLNTTKLQGVKNLIRDRYEFTDVICDKFVIYKRKQLQP